MDGGWSRGCTPPKECCRLPPTYFSTTWHQTRAFLIKVNKESDFSGWFDNSKKGEVSGHCRWMWGWSRGCTPPMECCRLPPTYFWTTWHQTRAFLIAVNNKKWFSGLFDNSEKEDMSGQLERCGVDLVVALHLRNTADFRLPTFPPHGTKLGHSWLQWKIKT